MAKRTGSLKWDGIAKKPKLEVNVHRGRANPSTSNIVEFWTSDDDDDVLLATQIAEENQRKNDVTQVAASEIPFTQFAANVKATTSTQQVLENQEILENGSNEIDRPTRMCIEEIFGTDETFVFLPDQSRDKKTDVENADKSTKTKREDKTVCLDTQSRRQLAQERQLKFLMERVDALKRENVKLQNDLVESSNQAVRKDGEVCLLRDELRQAHKLLEATKIDKLTITEEKNKACQQVMAKDTELSFTYVELTELKIRKAVAFERSTVKTTAPDLDERRSLLRIENFSVHSRFGQEQGSKPAGTIPEHPKNKSSPNQRSFFEAEIEQLQLCYALLQSERDKSDRIINQISLSVCRVFTEFWSYTQSLESPRNSMLYPHNHIGLHSVQSKLMPPSLQQPSALSQMERAILLRRYISTLAWICREQSDVSKKILTKKNGNNWLIEILIEAITNISYSFEVIEHSGVLEASAVFLHSLLSHRSLFNKPTLQSQTELLFTLLKKLVFTRPDPYVFNELSSCILLCIRDSLIMSKFCVNCPISCLVTDRVRSTYRFGPKSCLIQVYSGLLELCFYSDLPFESKDFKLLLSICEKHVRFVYQCFVTTPDFILRILSCPSFADDDKEDDKETFTKVASMSSDKSLYNNSSVTVHASIGTDQDMPQEIRCECYVKMCVSVVTLVFQMMFQWMMQIIKTDVAEVARISKISLNLFILIFREYYLTCIFRDSEDTTKHYLALLCTWWETLADFLNFEDIHLRSLKQLKELQFMLKPSYHEANSTNLTEDLAEWTRITTNVDKNVVANIEKDVTFDSDALFATTKEMFFKGLNGITYNFEKNDF